MQPELNVGSRDAHVGVSECSHLVGCVLNGATTYMDIVAFQGQAPSRLPALLFSIVAGTYGKDDPAGAGAGGGGGGVR